MVEKYIKLIEFIKFMGRLTRPIVLKIDIILILFNLLLLLYLDTTQIYLNSCYILTAFILSRFIFKVTNLILKHKITYFRLQRIFLHIYGFELCIYEV